MKRFGVDFLVGLFLLAGFAAFAYLSISLGEFSPLSLQRTYPVTADFASVSGLKVGAEVEMAGVPIGRVSAIVLGERDQARVTMLIDNGVQITADAIASIKTQGIIGDKYIRIAQGGAPELVAAGGLITETESAVDLEELISKYVFGKV
ncbi:MAG: outer membrane lipid asymmetry maintenance protein MlaD [Thermodesulfobacteriota bacterium]